MDQALCFCYTNDELQLFLVQTQCDVMNLTQSTSISCQRAVYGYFSDIYVFSTKTTIASLVVAVIALK